jgi:hypothetical protein
VVSRTHAILRSTAQDGMKGQRIDFLFVFPEHAWSKAHASQNRYVDEVQDNLLIDARRRHSLNPTLIALDLYAVLRAICHNPNGQFWAGDTAQTISVGSSFRFDDLKAFLHRNEASQFHIFKVIRLELGLNITGTSETTIRWNDGTPSAKVFPTCHKLPVARRNSEVRALGHSAHHEILALCDRHVARRERNCRRN